MSLRYGSVCSGIEAATMAWHGMGWKPSFFSEIDSFPRAVLAHHYPEVPLHGDFTTIQDGDYEPIDLLVGGTPCQSFSVAGLRKGLDDPRGNLMLGFLAVAKRCKPAWIVWENVPGVLSTNGGDDFATFLDGLDELGYIVDVDILDAQFFGVAQRRRRVFVCGQHRDSLLNQMTDSSALTIAQCLTEILHSILVNQFPEFEKEAENSDWPSLSSDGTKKRMQLFGLLGESDSSEKLQRNLVAANRRSQHEASIWVDRAGEMAVGCTREDLLTVLKMDHLSSLTDESLSSSLDDLFEVMKSFTTSTATSITTSQETSLYSAALNIARLIVRLNPSCPSWWSAASSSLTLLQDFTSYARQASDGLFAEPDWLHAGHDLIAEAESTMFALGHIGVENFGEVFSVSDSLSGHPAPSRETREETTGTLSSRTSGGGGLGTDFECAGGLQPVEGKQWPAEIANTLDTTMQKYRGLDNQHVNAGCPLFVPHVAHGTQDPCVSDQAHTLGRNSGQENAVCIQNATRGKSQNGLGIRSDGVSYTLDTASQHAVSVSLRGREGGATAELGGPVAGTLRAATGGGDKPHVLIRPIAWSEELTAHRELAGTIQRGGSGGRHDGVMQSNMAVRRLTPVECERLQGFPDNFTKIPYRNKPADKCPDGPRYKALGNSMAVPVMRWIGERIQKLEETK